MSNYEPHKLISLKLAGLSSRDKNWILRQLPEESRVKISDSIKQVKKFKVANREQLFETLIKESQGIPKDAVLMNQIEAPKVSSKLHSHLKNIVSEEITVTPDVRAFVTSFMESEVQ